MTTATLRFGECRRTTSEPGSWDALGDEYGAQEAPYMAWGRRSRKHTPPDTVKCLACGKTARVSTQELVEHLYDKQKLKAYDEKAFPPGKRWAVYTDAGFYCTACYRVGLHPPRGGARSTRLPDPATCAHDHVFTEARRQYCLNCGSNVQGRRAAKGPLQ